MALSHLSSATSLNSTICTFGIASLSLTTSNIISDDLPSHNSHCQALSFSHSLHRSSQKPNRESTQWHHPAWARQPHQALIFVRWASQNSRWLYDLILSPSWIEITTDPVVFWALLDSLIRHSLRLLYSNRLTGSIPFQIAKLTPLSVLYARNCIFLHWLYFLYPMIHFELL